MGSDKAKAWKVEWEDGEDRCEIVFADTRNEARRAADTQDAEWLQITAKRAPKFDGLTNPRALSMMQLLEGWWFFCVDCEHKVDVDGCWDCAEEEAGEDEYAGDRLDGAFVTRNGDVFCSEDCYHSWIARIASYRGNRLGVCLDAVERWPGIEIVHSNGLRGSNLNSFGAAGGVTFKFPGGEHTVDWVRGNPMVTVMQSDAEAWKLFAAECKAETAHG